jgi:hypothetical protein
MERFVLTDAQWAKMEPLCLGEASDPGRSGKDNRLFIEAVLWIARTEFPFDPRREPSVTIRTQAGRLVKSVPELALWAYFGSSASRLITTYFFHRA